MSIANVTLSDTFSQWVVKTNQLIVQSEETNTLAVAAFNTANDVSYTAANISAEILSTNNAFIINISNQLISSGNLTNAILSNTIITNTIYNNANSIAESFNANSNLGLAWNTANTGYAQANTARDHANTAHLTGNSSFAQANTARDHANVSFAQANTTRDHANVSFAQANTARDHANVSFAQANTARDQANTARDHANVSFAQANTARDHANAAFSEANISKTTIVNQTTSATDHYIIFTTQTSGNLVSTNIATTKLLFTPSTGELSATNYNSTSDISLKTNVNTIVNAIDKINELRGVSFDWIETQKTSYGVIAQEVEKIVPEIISTNHTGIKSVNYSGFTAFLIEAIKDLDARIKKLEKDR